MYLCRDGNARPSSVPWRLRDRPDFQNFQVCIPFSPPCDLKNKKGAGRLLGTPSEEIWPGVSTLPDYKPTFPQWSRKEVGEAVPQLDPYGLDLLKQLLVYDSAKRISGESMPPP